MCLLRIFFSFQSLLSHFRSPFLHCHCTTLRRLSSSVSVYMSPFSIALLLLESTNVNRTIETNFDGNVLFPIHFQSLRASRSLSMDLCSVHLRECFAASANGARNSPTKYIVNFVIVSAIICVNVDPRNALIYTSEMDDSFLRFEHDPLECMQCSCLQR